MSGCLTKVYVLSLPERSSLIETLTCQTKEIIPADLTFTLPKQPLLCAVKSANTLICHYFTFLCTVNLLFVYIFLLFSFQLIFIVYRKKALKIK